MQTKKTHTHTYIQKFRIEIIQNVWPKFLYMGPKNKWNKIKSF